MVVVSLALTTHGDLSFAGVDHIAWCRPYAHVWRHVYVTVKV